MRLRRERERHERAAVERSLERDQRGPLRIEASELDRVLDRFRARVEERRLRGTVEGRDRDEPLGELDVVLVRNDREVGVEESRCLFLHRFDHARMRVPDVQAADAAREVDERVAVDVGEERPVPFGDGDRQDELERVGDDLCLARGDLARARPRNGGLQADRANRGHEPTISARSDAKSWEG
jgi:hypothetical protein